MLVRILVLILLLCLPPTAGSAETASTAPADISFKEPIKSSTSDYPIMPRWLKLKDKPQSVQVFQIDREALGDRKPLLMVHGLRGEYRQWFRWSHVVKRFLDYPDFCRHYKIYLLRYDSTAPISKSVPQFKEAVLALFQRVGRKPVTILALSLGGTLAQEAMLDGQIDQSVKLVFTLATPFHGSPLFSADWFQWSVYKNLAYPWTRIDHSLAYRLYFQRNPNLLADLKWDNSDNCLPEAGPFRSRLPFGPAGNLTLARNENVKLYKISCNGRIDKSKFITYAGYLINPYLLPAFHRQFETTIMAPYTFITMKVPAHLAREHPVLKMLNREISRIIPAPNHAASPERIRPVYGLNDGITPVNSALFLSAETCKSLPLAREADLERLRGATDVRLARVFRDIDHLTFVDGYRPPHHVSRLLRDELNPKDGWRTMFDWMLSDLMQTEPMPNQLAKDSQEQSAIEQ